MRAIVIAILALLLGRAAYAEPVRTDHVTAELGSSRAVVAPGETFTVVLRKSVIPGWHTYWINPGDSGEPTRLAWKLPNGVTHGVLQWPAPTAENLGPLTNYALKGEVLYPIQITAPDNWPAGEPIQLQAHATWLVCEEICIPEEGNLSLTVPTAAEGRDDPVWTARAQAAASALPLAAEGGFQARLSDDLVRVSVAADRTGSPLQRALAEGRVRGPVHYFPYGPAVIDHAAPQTAEITGSGLVLTVAPSLAVDDAQFDDAGVLVADVRGPNGWTQTAYALSPAPVVEPPPSAAFASPPPSQAAQVRPLGLVGAIAFAFLGGIILNAMPCVFPVLSIKALSLASTPAAEARTHGLFYLVGVLATFLGLAAALWGLQLVGAQIGWGFQLQEPIVIAALATLFFVIGLNLFGLFEVGGALQNVGTGASASGGAKGAFGTGALAVIAASPCTAPFMAAALGWAATQPPAASFAVFTGLGLGFAMPFGLLSFAPGLRRILPKPGPWMESFKQFLAFPMFGAAIWLVWVLAQQTGPDGAAAILAIFTAIGFAVWAWSRGGVVWRTAGIALVLVILGASARPIFAPPAVELSQDETRWSPARVEALLDEGRGVFVDFTAAWCVTCKANEAVALTPAVREAMATKGIVFLIADWTRRDPVITQALADHGRAGVPLYLYYAPGSRTPQILPQLLTEDIVLKATGAEAAARNGDQT